jgi:hypothetical protein
MTLATSTPTVRSLPRAARSLIGVAACRDEWAVYQTRLTRVHLAQTRQDVSEISLPAQAGRSGVFGVRADDRPSVSFRVSWRGHYATECALANSNRGVIQVLSAGLVSAERR